MEAGLYELPKLDGNGKIYIGIPRERVAIWQFVDNRDSLLYRLDQEGRTSGYFQSEGHRVDRNRDSIVERFLDVETKPEWLVMIDTDMEHPATAPERLVAWEQPIVGALYFHRGQLHDPFVFKRTEDHEDKWGRMIRHWMPMRDETYEWLIRNNVPMRDGSVTIDNAENALWSVDAVATGCMAIHRSVFEQMPGPWFEYKNFGTSEDLAFCADALEHGIPVHCDMSTISGHYHWVPMGQAQFRTLYEGRGINLTTYRKGQAAQWVEEYTGCTFEEAVHKIETGTAHMVGDYWRGKFKGKKPSAALAEKFYEDDYTGQLYLIELLHWNFVPAFNTLRTKLIPVIGQNVLEIGSGIGSASMQLALQGNEVVSSEVNEYLRGFIKYRWNGLLGEFTGKHGEIYLVSTEWREQAEDAQFHTVVAFDVFEHLPKRALTSMMKDVHRVLPIGGRLIYHANWYQQDLYPMHYNHSKWWNEFIIELGFVPLSELEAVKVR
jgi:2-polyprenyl-3-methyl-5-hydroxy-6-metoxy-1,4-benzoquinol methylase